MIPTWIVVPFRDEPELTCKFLEAMQDESHRALLLFNNGSSGDNTRMIEEVAYQDRRVAMYAAEGQTIHQMWNRGWALARSMGHPVNLGFFNNDIAFAPGLVEALATGLRADDKHGIVYPDWLRTVAQGVEPTGYRSTTGTQRGRGMCGWCFMVRAEVEIPPIDPKLRWWCGDDFIELHMRQAGYQTVCLDGVPVDHIGGATSRNHAWVAETAAQDLTYWNETYA